MNCTRFLTTTAADSHRLSSAAMLDNLALRSGRAVRWDRAAERIDGNPQATALLDVTYRKRWPPNV